MKSAVFLLTVACCGSLCSTLFAEEPVFDSIDYASPMKYLVIADSLGDHDAIAKQANALKVSDDRKTVANTLRWMETQAGRPIGGVAGAGARVGRRVVAVPSAKIVVCTGPKEPIELGQAAKEGDIQSWHVHVWDLAKGGKSRALRAEVREGFAVSPDGKWLVTTAGRKIDLDADQESKLDGMADVTRVCFAPDGKTLLALAGPQADGTMRVFDWPAMKLRRQLPDQYGYMFDAAFSPDGRRVALVDKERHIRIWDLETGKALVRTEKPHSNSVRSLALSPDGKRLVSSGPNDEIWLWDAATGKSIGVLPADGEMSCLSFSADSRRLAGGGIQHLVVWDVATAKVVHRFESASGGTDAAWFSPEQSEIVAVRGFHGQRSQDGTIADIYPSVHTWTIPKSDSMSDTIDYASPTKYLVIADSLGDHAAIAKQANALKASDDRKTVANTLRWMETHLRYDGDRAYEWRNYDTVVSQRCYGGCADQAIVCGVLLKSAGIPVVWVKTMDVNWIWDFKKKRPFDSWSGHVFLEIYIDGKWMLLDPGASRIYVDYSTQSRILPGNRFAYHKGNDPKRMVMSLQWEEWKRQTASFFNDLDESLLPVDTNAVLDVRQRTFIIANSPYYQFFGELVRQHGFALGPSFNTDYEKNLPMAQGNLILIETHDGKPIVDVALLQSYFPAVPDGKQAGKLIDGETTIVFVDVATIGGQIATAASEQAHPRPKVIPPQR